ncbi:MAG TPA: response regulator [Amycolatopsis sp.]|jgi:DNA-binding response OmpR family regulator|nr:response regulator [Amycolatopsis sp.]
MARVLIVDDDADIRDLVAVKLSASGYDVVTAEDGVAGLAAARREHPDVLVSDVMMPGMSGIDVCRELRREPETANLPIILLTARAQDGDVESGFASGADDYLIKPFNPQELLHRISALLNRTRRR